MVYETKNNSLLKSRICFGYMISMYKHFVGLFFRVFKLVTVIAKGKGCIFVTKMRLNIFFPLLFYQLSE